MKATLFDYGAGNLHSLERALRHVGLSVEVAPDATTKNDLLVLPGVGAFGLAADRLKPFKAAIRSAVDGGLPIVGICLGMQLFFDASEEDGAQPGRGLAFLDGTVSKLRGRRVPHIGWTSLDGLSKAAMYFAHSYVCRPARPEVVVAWATHEDERFPAAVKQGRVAGVQFHPEKSSTAGLDVLALLVREVTQ
jgi:glutamine amidotransferase